MCVCIPWAYFVLTEVRGNGCFHIPTFSDTFKNLKAIDMERWWFSSYLLLSLLTGVWRMDGSWIKVEYYKIYFLAPDIQLLIEQVLFLHTFPPGPPEAIWFLMTRLAINLYYSTSKDYWLSSLLQCAIT